MIRKSPALPSFRLARSYAVVDPGSAGEAGSCEVSGVSTVLVARSGSAAETQQLAARAALVHEARLRRYGQSLTVSQLAHWLRDAVVESKNDNNNGGAVSLLVAGCDGHDAAAVAAGQSSGRPRIFSISPSGVLLEEKGSFAAEGSGSRFVLAHLDHHCKTKQRLDNDDDDGNGKHEMYENRDEQAAIDLCRQAIELAIHRDGSSGGFIRMHVITATGRREITIFPNNNNNNNNISSDSSEHAKNQLPGFAAATAPSAAHN